MAVRAGSGRLRQGPEEQAGHRCCRLTRSSRGLRGVPERNNAVAVAQQSRRGHQEQRGRCEEECACDHGKQASWTGHGRSPFRTSFFRRPLPPAASGVVRQGRSRRSRARGRDRATLAAPRAHAAEAGRLADLPFYCLLCSLAGAASGQKSANCEGSSAGPVRRSVRRRSSSARCATHAQRTTSRLVRGGPKPNGGKRASQTAHRRASYSSSTGFPCGGCPGKSWSEGSNAAAINCIETILAVSAVADLVPCNAAATLVARSPARELGEGRVSGLIFYGYSLLDSELLSNTVQPGMAPGSISH